jgi:hypothetical protein
LRCRSKNETVRPFTQEIGNQYIASFLILPQLFYRISYGHHFHCAVLLPILNRIVEAHFVYQTFCQSHTFMKTIRIHLTLTALSLAFGAAVASKILPTDQHGYEYVDNQFPTPDQCVYRMDCETGSIACRVIGGPILRELTTPTCGTDLFMRP